MPAFNYSKDMQLRFVAKKENAAKEVMDLHVESFTISCYIYN